MQQCAVIYRLTVVVKCVDYILEEMLNAEGEVELYKDMLAAATKAELIWRWDRRPSNLWPLQERSAERKEKLKSSQIEIENGINRMRQNTDLNDGDAKSHIEHALVAALAKYSQEWKLDKILNRKDEIFGNPPTIMVEATSKLQAQFLLQAQTAYVSLKPCYCG